jgi:hypothetical protein
MPRTSEAAEKEKMNHPAVGAKSPEGFCSRNMSCFKMAKKMHRCEESKEIPDKEHGCKLVTPVHICLRPPNLFHIWTRLSTSQPEPKRSLENEGIINKKAKEEGCLHARGPFFPKCACNVAARIRYVVWKT